ncbi:MAG: hypothetical protein IID46_15895 [Planctomycetes bacterium]|nr:hypothetical protein [Planctomycetota bacterium]
MIHSQNPDLRLLDESLQTKRGTDALTGGLPLVVAHEASRGDDKLFREHLLRSKLALQEAFGKVHTGYDGGIDLLDTAADVYKVSGRLLDAMENIRTPASKEKPRGRRRK